MGRQNRDARKQNERSKKRTEKAARMSHPRGTSRYALKAQDGGSSMWKEEPASNSTSAPYISTPPKLRPDQQLSIEQFVRRRPETPRRSIYGRLYDNFGW